MSPAPGGPTRLKFLRRRTVAGAAVLAAAIALVITVRGDDDWALRPEVLRLSAAQQALLPWRTVVLDGSAGVLDARGLPGRAAQRAAVERFWAIGRPIFCTAGRGRYAALTFDDGPSRYSDQVLRLLARAGAHGTFFLVGRNLPEGPDVPRRQLQLGAIGDHTWNHPVLTTLRPRALHFELSATKRALERATGQPITLFRPPYEARNPAVDAKARSLGLLQVLWNVDTADSRGASTAQVAANAESGLRPGAIILMHETYERSVRALPRILQAARRRGIELVSVPQLLALDPPPEAQVRAGGLACGERERYRAAEDAGEMRLIGAARAPG